MVGCRKGALSQRANHWLSQTLGQRKKGHFHLVRSLANQNRGTLPPTKIHSPLLVQSSLNVAFLTSPSENETLSCAPQEFTDVSCEPILNLRSQVSDGSTVQDLTQSIYKIDSMSLFSGLSTLQALRLAKSLKLQGLPPCPQLLCRSSL